MILEVAEHAGGPDDRRECRQDLVNSVHANSRLAGGTEVHQVRVGRLPASRSAFGLL
jgi:hypothetical protein